MAMRLRRSELVERNRIAVLKAARRVFLEKGYTGATLEAIADAAGFSKGVMYSQFTSKPDLFLALLEQRIDDRAAENDRIVAAHPGGRGLTAMLETAIEYAVTGSAWALLVIEFQAMAARDPTIGRRLARLNARATSSLASAIERLWNQAAVTPRFSAEAVAQFILALDSGIALERATNPSALPTTVVSALMGRALGFDDRGALPEPSARDQVGAAHAAAQEERP